MSVTLNLQTTARLPVVIDSLVACANEVHSVLESTLNPAPNCVLVEALTNSKLSLQWLLLISQLAIVLMDRSNLTIMVLVYTSLCRDDGCYL